MIRGEEAEKFLDHLSTNKIAGKPSLSATYTVWCRPEGGCVDDLIVYKESAQVFFVIVNASNRQKDLDYLHAEAAGYKVSIESHFEDGIIALQGPLANSFLTSYFPEIKTLKPMHFLSVSYKGKSIYLSATGYTGAGGVEIFAPANILIELWDLCLKEGMSLGLQPIGLGARDTLRLEMGYALYGHELSEEISASESVSAWTIKRDKEDFIGKKAILHLDTQPHKRSAYGIVLLDKGIAREGYEVYKEGNQIGYVTSGTFSPSLNQSIALILVRGALKLGENIEVQIRQNRVRAKIVKLPFFEKNAGTSSGGTHK